MESKLLIALLVLSASLVMADNDELRLRQPDGNTPSQTSDNLPAEGTASSTTPLPVSEEPEDEAESEINNQEQNQNQFRNQNQVAPFPFNLFGPPPRPHGPHGPFQRGPPPPFGNIFGNLFENMRLHREQMMQQFQQLEREAAQGNSTTFFSSNGVSYVKTCTVRRVDNEQQTTPNQSVHIDTADNQQAVVRN